MKYVCGVSSAICLAGGIVCFYHGAILMFLLLGALSGVHGAICIALNQYE